MRRIVLGVSLLAAGCYGGVSAWASGDDEADDGAAGDGDGGDGADDGADDGGSPADDPGAFGRAQLRRLTEAQWHQSVRDLLGGTVVMPTELDGDLHVEYFSTIGASTVRTTALGVARYEAAAVDVTGQVFADPDARTLLVGCAPAAADDACATDFLSRFGRRAWRRPLESEELDRYLALARDTAASFGDPWRGVEFAVAAMLQSTNFLYLVEVGESDPDDPDRLRYSSWEIAARLGAFLWNSVPDEPLLDAAESGSLTDAATLEAQARRLLQDPRARGSARAFFREYLHLDALDGLAKDDTVFPAASAALFGSMRGEVERLVEDLVFDRDDAYTALLTTRRTFVDDDLAALYGLPAPAAADKDAQGFAPVTIPQDWTRAGLLGTAAFLATNARVTRTSPTLRGLFVQRRLRCFQVPMPPDDVDAQLPEPGPGDEYKTMRERLEQHATDPACAACHTYFDPMGLTLEHFDGLGGHRDDDNGLPLDVSGELEGATFEGLKGLAAALTEDATLVECTARQFYRHATGHLESKDETEILEGLATDFESAQRRVVELMVAIVTSDGFRYR